VGNGESGRLGLGNENCCNIPKRINIKKKVVGVSCGDEHSAVFTGTHLTTKDQCVEITHLTHCRGEHGADVGQRHWGTTRNGGRDFSNTARTGTYKYDHHGPIAPTHH
jgi:hypothetical protein